MPRIYSGSPILPQALGLSFPNTISVPIPRIYTQVMLSYSYIIEVQLKYTMYPRGRKTYPIYLSNIGYLP